MTREMMNALRAVQAWVDAGRPKHSSHVHLEAKAASRALLALHDSIETTPGVYWRGTNRRGEYADVLAGVEIRSRNHATGTLEAGMSVSTTLATVWGYGYRYCYRVTGRDVGPGSDGEPVLVDVTPVGKIMRSEGAFRKDKAPVRWSKAIGTIADATGVDVTTLVWLWTQ